MKCKRQGCPSLLKGQSALASVFDERKARRTKGYNKPHLERWCLECYENYQAHKYTYVIPLPGTDRILRAKRVPRVDEKGELVEERPLTAAALAPIDSALPTWAAKTEKAQAPSKSAQKAKAKKSAPIVLSAETEAEETSAA